jgi:hypothetical protein
MTSGCTHCVTIRFRVCMRNEEGPPDGGTLAMVDCSPNCELLDW